MGIDYNEALSHKNLLAIYRGQLAEQFVGQVCSKMRTLYSCRSILQELLHVLELAVPSALKVNEYRGSLFC